MSETSKQIRERLTTTLHCCGFATNEVLERVDAAMRALDGKKFVTARIKLRNDNGPSGELSEPKEFVCVDGWYYEKDWIRSAPGVRAEQLEF